MSDPTSSRATSGPRSLLAPNSSAPRSSTPRPKSSRSTGGLEPPTSTRSGASATAEPPASGSSSPRDSDRGDPTPLARPVGGSETSASNSTPPRPSPPRPESSRSSGGLEPPTSTRSGASATAEPPASGSSSPRDSDRGDPTAPGPAVSGS